MLIHLGVLDLSAAPPALSTLFPAAGSEESLSLLLALPGNTAAGKPHAGAQTVPKEGPLLTTEQAYILRASAVDACELIVEYAHAMEVAELTPQRLEWIKGMTLPDVDCWLWAVAKDRPDYRQLERFSLRNTVFF